MMWRRIAAYFFLGLGFLTITFFRHYKGELIPYPFLFWIAGFAMFWIAFLFMRYIPTSKAAKSRKLLNDSIDQLRSDGERLNIDFTACELREHSFIEERQRDDRTNKSLTLDIEREIQGWNAFARNPLGNIDEVHVTQTFIVCRIPNSRTGSTDTFISRGIPGDKVTLGFYLDRQKRTSLYVDKSDRRRYYFDLDFLAG